MFLIMCTAETLILNDFIYSVFLMNSVDKAFCI